MSAADALQAGDVSRHHFGELLVFTNPHHDHQVELAGDRVDLGNVIYLDELLGKVRNGGRFGLDQDNGRDHVSEATAFVGARSGPEPRANLYASGDIPSKP